MTIDQVVYFVNHLADYKDADTHLRFWQGFWFMGIPALIALFHIVTLGKILRGNQKALIASYISMYFFSLTVPLILTVRSLLYINDFYNIPYLFILFLFIGVLYILGIEEYYPRYKYKTDEDYQQATKFPDGSQINVSWPNKNKLLALAVYLNINSLLLLISFILFMMWLIIGTSIFYAKVFMLVGGPLLLLHMVALRWIVRCKNCTRPIFNSKYDQSYLANVYFYKTAFDVLFKKKCECITCHAHYKV